MDEKLPRLSYELIEMLDQTVPYPEAPVSIRAYEQFDAAAVRRLAFIAGQRNMVDVLVSMMNEEKRKAGDSYNEPSSADGTSSRFARFLQTDGDVRSISVADIGGVE